MVTSTIEPATVVIDNGTGYTKMGYAGNMEPSYLIPSVIAKSVPKVSTTTNYYITHTGSDPSHAKHFAGFAVFLPCDETLHCLTSHCFVLTILESWNWQKRQLQQLRVGLLYRRGGTRQERLS